MLLLSFIWIALSALVGILGDDRTCGFGTAFLVSFFLSPLVGLAVVFASTRKDVLEFQRQMLEWNQKHALKQFTDGPREEELYKEIGKLEMLMELGKISPDHYKERKQGLKRALLYGEAPPAYVSLQDH